VLVGTRHGNGRIIGRDGLAWGMLLPLEGKRPHPSLFPKYRRFVITGNPLERATILCAAVIIPSKKEAPRWTPRKAFVAQFYNSVLDRTRGSSMTFNIGSIPSTLPAASRMIAARPSGLDSSESQLR